MQALVVPFAPARIRPPMQWERRLAREWLWFAGCAAAGLVLSIIAGPSNAFWPITFVLFLLVSMGRLTIWAVRTLRWVVLAYLSQSVDTLPGCSRTIAS